MKKSLETILSSSAIIIALASICISIWESKMMREHYHLSVRPQLEYSFSLEDSSAIFYLYNNGIGPAIITSRDYFVDGQYIDDSKNHFSILTLNALNINIRTTSYHTLGK